MDGKGYPDGLAGEAIPLGARILHVADAYDSMISKRTYRAAMSLHHALSELRAGAGTQFDPDCVAALEEYLASAHAA
jgi:HD-GYP domain-containing protein (c-di-GMP phosphodiesterase class II)